MMGEPVKAVGSVKASLPYCIHKLPDFVPLTAAFPLTAFAEALPTSLWVVLSANDTLTYDNSWMTELYNTFYASESDESRVDFWHRACTVSEWVKCTFDGTFSRYYLRAISVPLIAAINSDLAACCREMEAAGHPSYNQVAQHAFGVRQCLLT